MTTVLLADDHADLLAILSGRLKAAGFEVLEAKNGSEALSQVRAGRPEIAILDVMMPELNGFQVCRKIKADRELAGTKVVLLTAKATDADRFWGAEVGADLYLTKPIDPAEVVRRIQELALG
jgi:two-component system phosphate regulon response regulator PhoB